MTDSNQHSSHMSLIDRPVVGVGLVVFKEDAVLLIRRGKPPKKGEWSLPGGAQEVGETTQMAAIREVREETGIDVEIVELLEVIDFIDRNEAGHICHHYTLIDYLARWRSGAPRAMSDATHAAWVGIKELDVFPMWDETRRIIHLGARRLGLSNTLSEVK